MKKLLLLAVSLVLSTSVFAVTDVSNLLNRIDLQLSAEQWVTTQTARVNVSVNASVSGKGIERIQKHVIEKLKQLSNRGEWHILSFNRSKDRSGLESIQISAQSRLPQSELAALRSKAKSISKPGETYTVSQISFTPSEKEFRSARTMLRKTIYERAKKELEQVNKIYTDQKFYIHKVDFINAPAIMPIAQKAMYRSAAVSESAGGAPLNVGNKLNMVATVTLATLPEPLAKKSPLIN